MTKRILKEIGKEHGLFDNDPNMTTIQTYPTMSDSHVRFTCAKYAQNGQCLALIGSNMTFNGILCIE